MSDSVRPHRWQPTRLPHPWDSPGKNTGVGCHFLLQCVKVKSLSRVRLLATPWIAHLHPWDFPSKSTGVGCHCLLHRMIYYAYKLNKQGDNVQPCCTPFPILNQSIHCYMSGSNCCFLTYKFLRRQVRWSGIPISLRIFHSLL